MSARAARAAALPFALLAGVLRLAVAFRIEPLTWRLAGVTGLLLVVAAWSASALLPLAGYLLLTRRARRRPAAFDVDEPQRRFVAQPTPRWNGPWLVGRGWLVSNAVPTERVPGADRMRLAELPFLWVLAIVVVGAGLALIVVAALGGRPVLSLSPTGLTDQRQWRRKEVRWDELVPGSPQPPATRDPATLDVYLWAADTAGSFTRRHLPARDWHVDPAYLAHAIRTYAERRDRRADIGTPAELARLRETFTPPP